MKIKSLTLRNYKQFTEEKTFWFTDTGDATGEVNDITLLVGNNGTGKSSILQAVAAVVGGAAREHFGPKDLEWPGFKYSYLSSGVGFAHIGTEVTFSPIEIETIHTYILQLNQISDYASFELPDSLPHIHLKLDFQHKTITCNEGRRAFYQMCGMQYAKQLEAADSTRLYGKRFENVGTILWYDEQRSAYSIQKALFEEKFDETGLGKAIRDLLTDWYYSHKEIEAGDRVLRDGQFDKFARLKNLYETVFGGRKMLGTRPSRYNGNGRDIVFSDGKNEYDIAEFSAGERAVFPMLLDFANLNINNSIILIDEIELHLHPPLQYALLKALPKLGNNNQFIIATHSDYVVSWMAEDSIHNIIRLDA